MPNPTHFIAGIISFKTKIERIAVTPGGILLKTFALLGPIIQTPKEKNKKATQEAESANAIIA